MTRPTRDNEMISIALDQQAMEKQAKVPLPPIIVLQRAP
jgi:hypothetical protein